MSFEPSPAGNDATYKNSSSILSISSHILRSIINCYHYTVNVMAVYKEKIKADHIRIGKKFVEHKIILFLDQN